MSDEEKEALERIDYIQDFIIENGQYNTDVNDMQYFSKVLNLIEKQSKEIEEAEQKEKKAYIDGTNVAHELCNKMWKDKIKAKIEKIDKVLNEDIYAIDGHYDDRYYRYLQDKHILQSLLEKE